MKIRVCGYTQLQNNRVKRKRTKIDVPGLLVEELSRQGHVVLWEPAELHWPGAGSPDAQIVCVAPCMSINAPYALNGITALAHPIPTAVFYDDWQVRTTTNHHRGLAKRGFEQFNKIVGEGRLYFGAPTNISPVERDRIVAAAYGIAGDETPPAHWLAQIYPLYLWGDPSIPARFIPWKPALQDGHLTLDPSGVIERLSADRLTAPEAKERRWFLAALMAHKEWVDEKVTPIWGVDYAGSKKLIRESGGVRLKDELDVQRHASNAWGNLCPSYFHAGSGWWRSRFLYAAWGGSVLYCDPRDGHPLGGAYDGHSVHQIESCSTDHLRELAAAQAEALLPRCGTHQTFSAQVEGIVQSLKVG